jgi:hypothetical protein
MTWVVYYLLSFSICRLRESHIFLHLEFPLLIRLGVRCLSPNIHNSQQSEQQELRIFLFIFTLIYR